MELKIKYNLKNISNNEILILIKDDKIIFKSSDIAKIIGIEYVNSYIKDFTEEEKVIENVHNGFRKIKTTFLTEIGTIKFLTKYNNKKNAKNFKLWIENLINDIKLNQSGIDKCKFETEIEEEITNESEYCHPCKGNNKDCIKEGCSKKASYNFKGNKYVLYCKNHMLKDMVYINEVDYCIFDTCNKYASCNFIGEKDMIYCSEHKLDGMQDIKSKKCIGENCNLIPYFNFKGLSPKYCENHSEEGMINVKDKRCEKENCEELARYNFKEDKTRKYCLLHREPGMIDKKGDYCIFENCNTLASYNYQGQTKKLYCSIHYLPGMINVKHRKCLTENCNTIVNNDRYKGYCLYCFMHIFPLEKVSRNYRTKEKAVSDFIETAFPQHKFVINRKIYGGISKNRPDALLNKDTHILIIEIDENQHENYDCNCEMNRIGQILEDLKYKNYCFYQI